MYVATQCREETPFRGSTNVVPHSDQWHPLDPNPLGHDAAGHGADGWHVDGVVTVWSTVKCDVRLVALRNLTMHVRGP
jgi:hypothetical protein